MYIDPWIIQWGVMLSAAGCAFMIGKLWAGGTKEQTIEDTITYLIENNYLRSRLIDGEHELIQLDED